MGAISLLFFAWRYHKVRAGNILVPIPIYSSAVYAAAVTREGVVINGLVLSDHAPQIMALDTE